MKEFMNLDVVVDSLLEVLSVLSFLSITWGRECGTHSIGLGDVARLDF